MSTRRLRPTALNLPRDRARLTAGTKPMAGGSEVVRVIREAGAYGIDVHVIAGSLGHRTKDGS